MTGGWFPAGLRPLVLALWTSPYTALASAFEVEVSERRIFLWLPVAAGGGVALYFGAAQEPSALFAGVLAVAFAALAYAARTKPFVFYACTGIAALCFGLLSAQWRMLRVAAPVLDRVRIAELTGFVEEVDFRRQGARLLLRIASAEGLTAAQTPYRVRLTTRQTPGIAAGDFIALKARLLPPARAVLPGGYDFARDAYFARIGAVGSVLGRIEAFDPPDPPGLALALMARVDRARNALADRISHVMGGESGAIAVAMVTGKRDLLDNSTRELIREAGIFHIITISGIQMTLVAGIFFWGLRRMLAMSATLALNYPIKKWAAAAAIVGAIFYDICTGSRVGTERALFMTLIVFAAVLFDRQALTMRNLALAALVVIVLEPEAILGVSFQLSFAAVAALVAVYEARMRRILAARDNGMAVRRGNQQADSAWHRAANWALEKFGHGVGATLFSTLCATSATASFMAFHFHELSPYVLIGNPLTLVVIEIFAVPGALLGAALYPLGLDAPVWHYVGLGIEFVLWAARKIAAAPGATVHLTQFAQWSLVFLSLAVLCAVLWRTLLFRAMAVPFLAIGLAGAASGTRFDLAVSPAGDHVALRRADGALALVGRRVNPFAGEQWLRADGDGRSPQILASKDGCDALGCTAVLASGQMVSLVLQVQAFEEDCQRAAIIVTPLRAPVGCEAALVIDRRWLNEAGATALRWNGTGFDVSKARAADEDRPWSPAPKIRKTSRTGRAGLARRVADPASPPDDGDGGGNAMGHWL